jgi:hypothetical protein
MMRTAETKTRTGIGHNSRASDIKRTAEELFEAAERARAKSFDPASQAGAVRLKYLRKWTDPDKFPPVVQNLNAASLSDDVTGDEFKKMYVLSRIGGGKAEGIEIDSETLAILMHTDARGWRKAKGNIEAKGWLTGSKTYRNGKQSVNAYSLKNPALALIETINAKPSKGEIREGQTNPPKVVLGGSDEPSQTKVGRVVQCRLGGSDEPSFPGYPGVEEEERTHTARAREGCNSFSLQTKGASASQAVPAESERGLQKEQALEPELFGPSDASASQPGWKKRFAHVDQRWGYSPTAEPKRKLSYPQAQKFLNFANDCRSEFSDRLVNRAIGMILGNMETDVESEPNERSKPGNALKYFQAALYDKLRELRQKEHADRVHAKTVETLAEIDVKDRETAKAKGQAALDRVIARTEQKRIEDGNAKANRASAPRTSQNSRTITDENGKLRYNPELKLVTVYGQTIVFGEHANKLIAELEAKGATFDDVDEAFGKETGIAGNRTKSREEVLNSVRQAVRETIEKRQEDEIKAKYGEPESLCGGESHPSFKSKWVCLSREFVKGVIARCPTIVVDEYGRYRGEIFYGRHSIAEARALEHFAKFVERHKFSDDSHSVEYLREGYGVTLQKQVEDHVEAKMLQEHDENVEREKKEAEESRKHDIGVWIDGGTLEVSVRFQNQINKQIGKRPVFERLWDTVDSIRDKLAAFEPETVASRIRQLAFSAQSMSENAMRETLLRNNFAEVPL